MLDHSVVNGFKTLRLRVKGADVCLLFCVYTHDIPLPPNAYSISTHQAPDVALDLQQEAASAESTTPEQEPLETQDDGDRAHCVQALSSGTLSTKEKSAPKERSTPLPAERATPLPLNMASEAEKRSPLAREPTQPSQEVPTPTGRPKQVCGACVGRRGTWLSV